MKHMALKQDTIAKTPVTVQHFAMKSSEGEVNSVCTNTHLRPVSLIL